MATDNNQVWQELGIDLEKHDELLQALLPAFQEVYRSQTNHPARA